ncbi:hypothetical protein AB6T38_10225 [Aliiglaciecola sp. SL4]|uniref:hypothetical protein n=1 Tax=Aliiglaciecola sp. SL4 TaxID=3239806 RepID=UPI00355B69D8
MRVSSVTIRCYGDAIILDSDSTFKLASNLGGRENITVVSNSINIVNELKLQ